MLYQVEPGKRYLNKRTQRLYRTLLIGRYSETSKDEVRRLVVYVRDGHRGLLPWLRHFLVVQLMRLIRLLLGDKQVWVRPYEIFQDKFDELQEEVYDR